MIQACTGSVNFTKSKMMKKFVVVSLAFVTSMAFAHNCPNEMKAIDAKMANAKLSDSDLVKVKALREEGEKFHKAGKHDESMKALGEAKKMLGI